MPKIEFNQEKVVKRPDGSGTKYEAGKTYELNQTSASHFTSRGLARAASDKAKVSDPIEIGADGRPMEEISAEAEKADTDERKAADERKVADDKKASESKRAKTAQPFRTNIPDNWRSLPEAQQRALASSLTSAPVNSKDEAVAAIEAELKRRVDGEMQKAV